MMNGESGTIAEQRRQNLLRHALGETVMSFLTAPDVVEISLNDDGRLWVQRSGQEMEPGGMMSAGSARTVISLVADFLGQVATHEKPIVEGELPLPGSPRFEGLIPPVVTAPSFSIRKHHGAVIPLAEYVAKGTMPEMVYGMIKDAIVKRLNILVVGGTGSGKTTLVNGIIAEISALRPKQRLVLLEDTRELKSESPNTLRLRSTLFTPIYTLAKAVMRLRPDRIIVGEVRDQCALDMLMAWNTGHPGGVCTTHCNEGIDDALMRLEELIMMGGCARPMQSLIGRAVDLILHIGLVRGERKLLKAVRVRGFDKRAQEYDLEVVYDHAREM